VIKSDCKKRARLNAMRYVLHKLPYTNKDLAAIGTLDPLLTDWCSGPRPVYVVYPPNRHLSNKLRVFVDWIAELFATHDLIQQKCSLAMVAKRKPQLEAVVAAAA